MVAQEKDEVEDWRSYDGTEEEWSLRLKILWGRSSMKFTAVTISWGGEDED
jgi:hypothetical protein